MKKFFVISVVVACIVLAGCKDNDDGVGVTVTMAKPWGAMLNPHVDVVKAVGNDRTLTESKYDGGFTLKLPASVSNSLLTPKWDPMYLLSLKYHGMTVTGDNVRELDVDFEAYKSGNYVGDFRCMKFEDPIEIEREDYYHASLTIFFASYVYVDGNVTGNGKVSDEWVEQDEELEEDINFHFELEYKFSMNKGWNKLYITLTSSFTIEDDIFTETLSILETTTDPGGLRWDLFDLEQQTNARLLNSRLLKTKSSFVPKKLIEAIQTSH